jgi:hypothetical protein
MSVHRRYYATQYGYIWSMTKKQFQAFLENGVVSDSWNLEDFGRRLRGPGKHGEFPVSRIISQDGRGHTSIPSRMTCAVVIRPLDWTRENFEDALRQWHETGTVMG